MPPKLTLIIPKKMCPYRLFIYMACGHTVLVPLDRFWPSDTAPCQLSFRTKPEPFSKETPNVHPIHNIKFYKLCPACEAQRDSRLETLEAETASQMASDSASTRSRMSTRSTAVRIKGDLKEMMVPELPKEVKSLPGTPKSVGKKHGAGIEGGEEERKAAFWKTAGEGR